MIYQTVNRSDFIKAFDEYNRAGNFTINARNELFEYYSELSDVAGDFELDVIAICCDWGEYTEKELIESFGDSPPPSNPARCEEVANELAEELAERGMLIRVEHIAQPDTYLFSE